MAWNKYWEKFLILIIACASLIFVSCNQDAMEIHHSSKVIGHGGMGVSSTYPMNSIESFLKAMHLGADGVEIDVQMTLDGVLVAFHDEFLDARSTGQGQIHELNWEDIRDVHYTNYPYLSYKLQTLENILEALKEWNAVVVLDIKSIYDDQMRDQFKEELAKVLLKYGEQITFIIESKEAVWLSELQLSYPFIKTLLYAFDFQEGVETMEHYEIDGIALELSILEDIEIEVIKNRDFEMSVFNVHNKRQNKTSLELNIDYIQTENIQQLINLRGKH